MVIQGGQAKHSRRLAWAVARGWSSRFMERPVLPTFLGGFLVWGSRSSGEGGGGQDWGWQGSSFEWGGPDPGQRAPPGRGRVCTMPKAEELWRCVLQHVPWWDSVLKWGDADQGEGQCRFGGGLQRTLLHQDLGIRDRRGLDLCLSRGSPSLFSSLGERTVSCGRRHYGYGVPEPLPKKTICKAGKAPDPQKN